MRRGTLMTMIVVLTLLPLAAFGGNIDSPGTPPGSGSGMPTLEDIYDYLTMGAPWTDPGSFQEPSAAPASTVYTLKEIYEDFKALIDKCNNPPATPATPADVRNGVTFFSTDPLKWGPQTGTYNPAPVEKTGQTTSKKTGDDGDLEIGVAWPNPRFTDNGNGTVTDNLTGLIWLKDANCMGRRNWAGALTQIGNLNTGTDFSCDSYTAGTFGDWRLPNVKELQSLIHYGVFGPALPNTAGTGKWSEGDPFTGVQSVNYWSSTTNVSHPDHAWYVGLSFGYVYYYDKTYTDDVWPVRGGE